MLTRDNGRFKAKLMGWTALLATLFCIVFSFSRAPLASYCLIIYVYALITYKRFITYTVHTAVLIGAVYAAYLFAQFEQNHTGIIEVFVNTIDFSNPSSVGHLVEWIEGIMAMIQSPLGLGLGTSGRVAGTFGENVGGENQFIIIGVQAGIIALLLYLTIYILFIKMGLKWVKRLKGKERKICMAVLLIKIGFIIPMLTSEVESSSYLSYMNWLLSGLFISVIMQQHSNKLQPATT
ncbi:O-antigen ligase family protein [Mucilaginibacter antarcticus]|uniref:O-antigen ligase family protein n=1 Tax=Mucilaginibacter antarcticus TaxID=1855725 RepID=UPI003641FCB1